MIYCILKGGLGNMLFQIAAVKSLAIDNGVDFSFPNLHNHYGVMDNDNHYNPTLKHSTEYQSMFKDLNVIQPTSNLPRINYPFHYNKLVTPSDDFIVDGFFQSEKYFNHNREGVLDCLKIPESVKAVIDEKYGEVLKGRSTSIHVRRGDYLKYPNHHPTQTLKYFQDSVDKLKDVTDKIIVFSDDIPWCKENFNFDNTIYIEDEKDYIELYLMSLCTNNITSNSSFSWWGAWMNENETKIVIGPTNWFGPAIQHDTGDILPESWIKI